jgi:hypothetical protein
MEFYDFTANEINNRIESLKQRQKKTLMLVLIFIFTLTLGVHLESFICSYNGNSFIQLRNGVYMYMG